MVFYSQRSQITSGMFLAILTGTPIIIYRKKSWTHHTGRGESLAIQHPSQEVARAREMLSPQQLALTWAQSGSTLGPPLLVEQGAQVPMICLCPLGQPHLFTSSSQTLSVPCIHQKEYWRFGPFCWCTPASISTTHCSELAGVSLREESTSNAARIPSRLLKREDWTDFCTRQTPHVKKIIGGSVLNISLWKFNQIMRSFELEGICKDHLTQFRCDEQG